MGERAAGTGDQHMRSQGITRATNVADVLGSTIEDGEIRVNLGFTDSGKGIGQSSPCWFGADGFVSVPNDPSDDGACMAWHVLDGNNLRVLGYRDNRNASKLATLEPGDRGIVTDGDCRFIMRKADSSISIFTSDEASGEDMIMTLSGSTGVGEIRVGGSSIKIETDRIVMMAAGGASAITLDSDGMNFTGNNCALMSQSGQLGSISPALPPMSPPPGAMSVVIGPTGMAGVGSSKWTCALIFALMWAAAVADAWLGLRS